MQERSLLLQKVVTLLQKSSLSMQTVAEKFSSALFERRKILGESCHDGLQSCSVRFDAEPDGSRMQKVSRFFSQNQSQPEKEVLHPEENETRRQKNDSCL